MLQLFFLFSFCFQERGEHIKRLKNNHKWAKPFAKTTNLKDDIQDNQSTKLANTTQKQKKKKKEKNGQLVTTSSEC